jgi:hypothetical protein
VVDASQPNARRPLTLTARAIAPAALLLAAAAGMLPGCSDSAPAKPRAVDPIVRDIPAVLRGTIGSETSLRGIEPILVAGYGVVVGLNGTGGGPYPEAIASTMERELSRGGIGRGGVLTEGPLAGKSPRQVLADPNVAVVIVEGVVSAGAPKEARFDVRVRSLPGSAATSLEGGTLWTTELRLGPVTPFGSMRTRKLGEAKGPLFINPFSAPGSTDGGRKDLARVLSGGVVTDAMPLEITLDNPSHPRAASIQMAINSRFPAGPGDDGQTARARSANAVTVRVPRAWVEKPGEFLKLLENIRIDSAFPEEFAKRYAEELSKQPVLAEELHWCLRAIGKPAAPFVRGLYDSAELIPRWAAVRVGAAIADPAVSPHLISIAKGEGGEPVSMRAEAAQMLGRIPADARLGLIARELASKGQLEVRAAAYEAMAERGDPSIQRIIAGTGNNRFAIDVVPATEPLLYAIQSDRPRIVIFGNDLTLVPGSQSEVWNGRLLVAADRAVDVNSSEPSRKPVRLMYRDWRSDRATQGRAEASVRDFIRFLAQKPTPENPEPGLGLTYSEVVGVLYQLQNQRSIAAGFSTEEDRLAASITVASTKNYVEPRPESEADRERIERERDAMAKNQTVPAPGTPAAAPGSEPTEPRFVPIVPKPKKD